MSGSWVLFLLLGFFNSIAISFQPLGIVRDALRFRSLRVGCTCWALGFCLRIISHISFFQGKMSGYWVWDQSFGLGLGLSPQKIKIICCIYCSERTRPRPQSSHSTFLLLSKWLGQGGQILVWVSELHSQLFSNIWSGWDFGSKPNGSAFQLPFQYYSHYC